MRNSNALVARPSAHVWSAMLGASLYLAGMAVVGCGTDEEVPGEQRSQQTAEQPQEALAEATERTPSDPAVHTMRSAESGPVAPNTLPPSESPSAEEGPREATYADGERLYGERRYHDAAQSFATYLERHPRNAGANYMLGLSTWKSGSPGEAEEPLRAAIELAPDLPKPRLNLVRVLLDLERGREAVAVAEEAVARFPELAEARRLLGRARHEAGHVPEAEAAYREALRLDPRDLWAMNNLGVLRLEQGRADEALLPLARLVELSGRSPVFRTNFGAALERAGFVREAGREYAIAVEADSTYASAVAGLERVKGAATTQSREPFDHDRAAARFEEWVRETEHAEAHPEP